ncbi:MAG: glycosyltransferase [Chlorobiaceae bacterium]|nr:glycosyltransferase [Chlorobiaceae bacterium]
MRISIITPSYNQGEFIEDTIKSVINQDHKDIEHIIMDGGSTDQTVSILKKYDHLKWVSERDSGQSNAINMGFRKVSGNIIAWLNSDDYYEDHIFGDIVKYFEQNPECMLLYGDITFVNKEGHSLYKVSGDTIDYGKLIECPDIVRQPSFFWRREVIEIIGGVDEDLHLVMDFDFFLRIARRYKFHYINRNLSYYRTYEVNKTSALPRRQVYEIYKVFRKQHIPMTIPRANYLIRKYFNSIGAVKGLAAIIRHLRKRG